MAWRSKNYLLAAAYTEPKQPTARPTTEIVTPSATAIYINTLTDTHSHAHTHIHTQIYTRMKHRELEEWDIFFGFVSGNAVSELVGSFGR